MDKRKTIDADIRDRVERECRSIMEDHPEVEAVGVMFLSKQLANTLSGMIVGADGPQLRPDQNVRMFEVWVRIGSQLLLNNQRDVMILDQMLAKYARKLTDAKAEPSDLSLSQATRTTEGQP